MLKELFVQNNINLKTSQQIQFEKFLNLFMEKNSQINLSAIRDEKWVIEKHFIDSVILNNFVNLKWNILDIWTWWGFPGIPLAITNENCSFTLLDSTRKKIDSVNFFCKELDLKNCSWVWWRAEELVKNEELKWQFDYVISRATAYLPQIIEWSFPFLKKWWSMIFYKLFDEKEIKDWLLKAKKLHLESLEIKDYELSWQKRSYIFIK